MLGDWDPVSIKDTGSPISLSTLVPLRTIKNEDFDIESLVVRKGCTLEVFKKADCTGAKYTFKAGNNWDRIERELEDSDAHDFGEYTNYNPEFF